MAGTPILLMCLFWTALPAVCPAWNRLLRQISLANQLTHDGIPRGDADYDLKTEIFGKQEELTTRELTFFAIFTLGFYVAKTLIARNVRPGGAAFLWYAFLVSLSLPYFYICLEDWDNPHVSLTGNWLGTPVMFLVVPTLSFALDTVIRDIRVGVLVLRSLIEIVILIPLWTWFWVMLSFGFLGFIWL